MLLESALQGVDEAFDHFLAFELECIGISILASIFVGDHHKFAKRDTAVNRLAQVLIQTRPRQFLNIRYSYSLVMKRTFHPLALFECQQGESRWIGHHSATDGPKSAH
jgi:hypothetical protein